MPNPKSAFHAWRSLMGFTQDEAAYVLRVSVETIGRYDRGERAPPESTLLLMELRILVNLDGLSGWPQDPDMAEVWSNAIKNNGAKELYIRLDCFDDLSNGHLPYGSPSNGHQIDTKLSEHPTESKLSYGHLSDRELSNGQPTDSKLSNGHPTDSQLSDGHQADRELSNGRPADSKLSNGHPTGSQLSDGHQADGKLSVGEMSGLVRGGRFRRYLNWVRHQGR